MLHSKQWCKTQDMGKFLQQYKNYMGHLRTSVTFRCSYVPSLAHITYFYSKSLFYSTLFYLCYSPNDKYIFVCPHVLLL